MTTGLGFTIQIDQEKSLPANDLEMHAILRVGAHATEPVGGAPAGAGQHAVVIVVDCSGSMDYPPAKIAEAKQATIRALGMLPDRTLFAVVKGNERAESVYPAQRLAVADDRTRRAAVRAVERLYPAGGTAIGSWLRHARELLAAHPLAIRHAILLTDGRNESESAQALEEALAACAGQFVCDARGIGEDWDADQLVRIASALRGSAGFIVAESELTAEFGRMLRDAMEKTVPDLRIRVTTMAYGKLGYLKQRYPMESDLADGSATYGERTAEFSTGTWGVGDTREYHLCLSVSDTCPMQEDVRLARIELVRDGHRQADPVPVTVHRMRYAAERTNLPTSVVDDLNQQQARLLFRRGAEAFNRGDHATAGSDWGRALAFATGTRDEIVLRELHQLVEVVDGDAERVRIRPDIRRVDVERALIGISRLPPSRLDDDSVRPPVRREEPAVTCPGCRYVWSAGARYCMNCGRSLSAGATDGG